MAVPEKSGADQGWGGLLAAAQTGDAEAYRAFLAAALPFLRAIARRRCFAEDAAEDVVQDALLTVHRVRHTYEPGRPVKPWLAAIVIRRAIDSNRRGGRLAAREIADGHAYETFADPGAKQEESSGTGRSLARLMAGLTPKQKEAINLVKLRELSLSEASAESGQSVPALKVNIHRAMKKLRLALGKDGPE